MSEVHILYRGQTHDIDLENLIPPEDRAGLGIAEDAELTSGNLTGDQIKRALANHFDQPLSEFEELIVDFHKTHDITVRPNAEFGVFET